MNPPTGTVADVIIAVLVTFCWVLQLLFMLGHLLLTRWKAAELGPYVVRFNAMVTILLTLAFLNAVVPDFQVIRTGARLFSYVVLALFEINQWALLQVILKRAWQTRRAQQHR